MSAGRCPKREGKATHSAPTARQIAHPRARIRHLYSQAVPLQSTGFSAERLTRPSGSAPVLLT
jgi:hypothetical protein